MDKRTYNYENLNRHGVTENECNEVTAEDNLTTEEFDYGYNKRVNWCMMFVGFTTKARLLEIGVEVIKIPDDCWIHIFHADDATPRWQRRFNQRKRK
jgi:hypothetical protein